MLKCRTGYSFRAAAGKIDKVLDRLQELGHTSAPITDRASTFGFHRWKKACEARGMTPVFGVELAVTASINAKKPSVDYWTFVARDSLEPINRLMTLATQQFRYQPLLRLDQALAAAKDVNVMIGHRPPMDLWDLDELPEGVAVGLMPSSPVAVVKRALAKGWNFAASSDNRFPTAADKGFYEVLTGRNAETQTYPQHILSDEEWRASIAHHELPEAVIMAAQHTSEDWLAACTAQLQKSSLPHIDAPQTLREMCMAGAEKLGCDLADPIYAARLERELSLIGVKEYEDYFYIVADICQWARERMLVGPARGSSCGSLVCYLLGITTVDPIPFGLIFERFISINRGGWKFPKEIEIEGLFPEGSEVERVVRGNIKGQEGAQDEPRNSAEDEFNTAEKVSERRADPSDAAAQSLDQGSSGSCIEEAQWAGAGCQGSGCVPDDDIESQEKVRDQS